jgi:hypothetical protein
MKSEFKLRRSVGVGVDVVVKALENHRERHGSLQAQPIVNEARPEEAPLHPCFEWDDAVAANEHRLMQARTLIRAVHVVADGEDRGSAYVNVKVEGDEETRGQYLPVAEVVSDEDLYRRALAGLVGKLGEAERAVRDLQRAAGGGAREKKVARAAKKITEAKDLLAAE